MYEKELTALSRNGARYLVIGGVALGLHGYLRATADLDILPSLDADNLGIIAKTLKKLGYVPRVPVDPEEIKDPAKREYWYKQKNMRVFSFINSKTNESIDLMIYHPLDFEKAYTRRLVYKINNVEVAAASIKDMIDLKKISGRPQDEIDIRALKGMLGKEKK